MPNLVGTGLNQVPTNSMLGGLAYQDPEHASIKNLDIKNLSQINSEIADTAVDVFVYDTRKDSDGGAWRKRTQNTSWYNETLGTATRGTRREFPAVAVIVAEDHKLTIYDGDDPDLPMWMVFNADTSAWNTNATFISVAYPPSDDMDISSVKCLNAKLVVSGDQHGVVTIDFINESQNNRRPDLGSFVVRHKKSGSISLRNDTSGQYPTTDTGLIVNRFVNDVAMTVLPNAPIDDTTGLPIPTIAVATQQGVSVITDSGTVYDLTPESNPGYSAIKNFMQVAFTKENHIVLTDRQTAAGFSNVIYLPFYTYDRDLTNTYSKLPDSFSYTWGSEVHNDSTQIGEWKPQSTGEEWDYLTTCSDSFALANGDEPAGIGGIVKIGTYPNHLMVNRITKDYNTGWAYGLNQGIFLSDTDDTNKTNGQTDPDRSHNNLALTVTGTITKSAVATGADLVAYSGFTNATNYMDNTSYAINFGNPVTISIMVWQKLTDISNYSYSVSFSHGNTIKGGISNGSTSSGYPGQAYFNMGNVTIYTGSRVDDGNWHCLVGTIEGTVKKFYLDGNLASSATIANHDMSGISRIHAGSYGINHDYAHRGSLALLRVSKSVPSATQIKKMYEDEKHLFQENAKATLYGSSDAVTALAFDDTTNLLHVGTSSGRSEFQGLRRINNTTDAVTTAISASNGLVAEQ